MSDQKGEQAKPVEVESERSRNMLENLQIRGIQAVNDEEQKTELELQRDEEKLPMQVRERRQTV